MNILIFSILFTFLDFLAFTLLKGQVLYLLLLFYSVIISSTRIKTNYIFIPILFFAIEESITLGLAGASLIFLIPSSIIALKLKKILFAGSKSLYFFLFLTNLFFEIFLIKGLILGQKISIQSTISIILVNMLLMIIYLKFKKNNGALSNRRLEV